jgi:hypothetical protein
MVTIYDMATGECIAQDGRKDVSLPMAAKPIDNDLTMLAPRLQTVAETAVQPTRRQLPPDLAAVSIAAFLAGQ